MLAFERLELLRTEIVPVCFFFFFLKPLCYCGNYAMYTYAMYTYGMSTYGMYTYGMYTYGMQGMR